ncbi:MAG TPA: hypothetical protein VH575_03405 [Gemmataceae bacterium]|jgi:hypothetical protein
MKRTKWRLFLSFFAGALVTTGAVSFLLRAVAESKLPPPPNPPAAANTAQVVPQNAANGVNLRDFGKGVIEIPTKQLLAANTVPAAVPPGPAFVNPKVEPGKVRWHNDFDAACRAAKKSGKPVLLFQMMGKLDEGFC